MELVAGLAWFAAVGLLIGAVVRLGFYLIWRS